MASKTRKFEDVAVKAIVAERNAIEAGKTRLHRKTLKRDNSRPAADGELYTMSGHIRLNGSADIKGVKVTCIATAEGCSTSHVLEDLPAEEVLRLSKIPVGVKAAD